MSDIFNQLDILASSRTTDPETSRAAAASVTPEKRTDLQRRILRAFAVMGPMTDKALYETVRQMELNLGMKPSSPSGVRSRRNELTRANTDRLYDLAIIWLHDMKVIPALGVSIKFIYATQPKRQVETALAYARKQLEHEGYRSPLIASGRTEVVDGRSCTVWEEAK